MRPSSTTAHDRRGIAARTLAIDAATAEVVREFRTAGIDVILLKGPSFESWLYDEGDPREYVDSDLLVPPADVASAEDVLASLGFEHAPLDDIPGDKPWHAHAWHRPSDGVEVDLHRTLIGVGCPPETLWQVLDGMTEPASVAGTNVRVLTETARAFHAALHVAQGGKRTHRAIIDLARAVDRVAVEVWEGAAGLAERLEASAALAAGLTRLSGGGELVEHLGLPQSLPVDVQLRASDAPSEAIGLYWLASRPGLRAKARLILRKTFPPPAFLHAWTPLASRGLVGLALGYLYRPVWLAARLPNALVALRRTERSRPAAPESREVRGSVLVVGPDGAGKTTVADAVEELLRSKGVAVVRGHHRPGVLFGSRQGDDAVTEPHREPPRRTLASLLKLTLVYLDHLLGALGPWRRARRNGVLLIERGWHDLAVDPRRYRVPTGLSGLVQTLGRRLPKFDLVAVLEGEATALHDRKPELPVAELSRQQARWRAVAGDAGQRVSFHDPVGFDADHLAREIVAMLDDPAPDRWVAAPLAPRRLDLRVRAGRTSLPALAIYRPQRRRARIAEAVNHALLSRGLAKSTASPLETLDDIASELGLAFDGVAAFRSSAPGRFVVGLALDGRLASVLKVGPPDDEGLQREAAMLDLLATREPRIPTPTPLWHGEACGMRVVATQGLDGAVPADLDLFEVADLCTRMCQGADPVVHGDLAPWNIVRHEGAVVVLDWEKGRRASAPMHDLCHYVVQEGALLRRHGPDQAVGLLTGEGSPGRRHLVDLGVTEEAGQLLLRTIACEDLRDPHVAEYRHMVRRLVS